MSSRSSRGREKKPVAFSALSVGSDRSEDDSDAIVRIVKSGSVIVVATGKERDVVDMKSACGVKSRFCSGPCACFEVNRQRKERWVHSRDTTRS